jgi:hypothetical protein
MVCFGAEPRDEITERYPRVLQILWPAVKEFIWDRFRKYRNQKSGHVQWDEVGKGLWDLAAMRDPETGRDVTQERFVELLRVAGPAALP